jgi:(E)-4-hydroxy-3-methylbut-2-enyl-diphosphate synthase
MLTYCNSRTQNIRRRTREVVIGDVRIGAEHPIAVQSMTTTKTEDVAATVAQARELIEAGCEIVRVTAPSLKAARALKAIREQLTKDGFTTPLVADIHFLPKAAMEAVEHVEKVRINPGNYVDYKKFKVVEYTDVAYQEEIERLHDAFTPFILRCKELGRAIRIGTNHGSLSDRIMNRYGDTPEGMVESALEFIRIAESHSFHDIVLSMKASNPKVMISAYRLAVARMLEEGMAYPLHLGVTEAGDGEDARVKSCIGIGTLLTDGLGDTLRVSLTEDPVYEIPVGKELVAWAARQQLSGPRKPNSGVVEKVDFYHPCKRGIDPVFIDAQTRIETDTPPLVAISTPHPIPTEKVVKQIAEVQVRQKDAKIEYWITPLVDDASMDTIQTLGDCLKGVIKGLIIDCKKLSLIPRLLEMLAPELHYILNLQEKNYERLTPLLDEIEAANITVCIDFAASENVEERIAELLPLFPKTPMITCSAKSAEQHATGTYRELVAAFETFDLKPALWLRNCNDNFTAPVQTYADLLMESSILSGSLLCEGAGNIISIESEPNLLKATALAYNILQGARARISKTEFVACPSCGRTLFDLQSTTQKIRVRTNHLKGVTIAIMGCIVNGPGEMADADFGYVGGAPGKVNLYVGKSCVRNGIPEGQAVDALVELIHEQGRWIEPDSPIAG